jgi:hypothetical protein
MATRHELEEREDVKAILVTLRADPKLAGKRLRPIETTIGVIVVQNPSRGQYNITGAQLLDEDKGAAFKAMAGLFRMSIVYPSAAELAAALEDMPAALDEPEAMKEFRRHIGHCREVDQK